MNETLQRAFMASLLVTSAVLAACGAPLEGDWFYCDNLGCSELDSTGVRFNGDGTLQALAADGSKLDAGERYCHSPIVGRWELDAAVLVMSTFSGGDLEEVSVEVVVEEGFLIVTNDDGEATVSKAISDVESIPCSGDSVFRWSMSGRAKDSPESAKYTDEHDLRDGT